MAIYKGFNSLFEMPMAVGALKADTTPRSFNSLFEMPASKASKSVSAP